LEAAAKRVRDIAKDGAGAIRMEFADGKLKVSAKASDQDISSTIDTLNTQGETTRTALNQKYLLGYLNGKQGSSFSPNIPMLARLSSSTRNLPGC